VLVFASAAHAQSNAWTQNVGEPNGARVIGVAALENGDALITAERVGPTPTRLVRRIAPDGTTRWTRTIEGQGYGTAFDATGAVIPAAAPHDDFVLAGNDGSLAHIDGVKLTPPKAADGTTGAMYVARFAPDGSARWVHDFPSTAEAYPNAVSAQGNVVVGGSYYHAASFKPDETVRSNYTDGFVTDLDGESGALRWVRTLRGGNTGVSAIGVTENGDVLAAGSFEGAVDAGGGWLLGSGAFVVRYGADGSPRWTKAIAVGDDVASDAVLSGSTFYVAVTHWAKYAKPDGSYVDGSAEIVALSAGDGSILWRAPVGSPVGTGVTTIDAAADLQRAHLRGGNRIVVQDGEVRVATIAKGTLQHGALTLPSSSADKPYLLAFDAATGAPKWARAVSAPGDQALTLLAAPVQHDVLLYGELWSKPGTLGDAYVTRVGP
jgi:outer membrane protein assembly factor BamB